MKNCIKIGILFFVFSAPMAVLAEPANEPTNEPTSTQSMTNTDSNEDKQKLAEEEQKKKAEEELRKKEAEIAEQKKQEAVALESKKQEAVPAESKKEAENSKPPEIINTDKDKNLTVNDNLPQREVVAVKEEPRSNDEFPRRARSHEYERIKEELIQRRHEQMVAAQNANRPIEIAQAQEQAQEDTLESRRALRRERHRQRMQEAASKRVNIVSRPETKTSTTVVVTSPTNKVINDKIEDRIHRQVSPTTVVTTTPTTKVVNNDTYFVPKRFQGDVIGTTIVANRIEDRFKERMLREEQRFNDREIDLRKRELGIREREFRLREREMSDRELRRREWNVLADRDAELRYLLWRERELRRYYWRDRGRICYYYTYYKTGVRVNKKVKICRWKNGVYTCYHPKRYYIYPVTKIVCRRDVIRREFY